MAAAKEQKKTKSFQRWKMYEVSGGKLKRKNRSCPKCGQGDFMATHKDRISCGKCKYTEFTGKKQ